MRATLILLGLLTMSTASFADDPKPAAAPTPAATPPVPCAGPEYRQFDFWIGTWDVHGPKDAVVGHSRIESILGGCVIAEHWSSGPNGANDGKSYNIYDRELGKWEQFWVDASGSRLLLSGGLVGADMVLEGVQSKPDPKTGIAQRERITWTPNADGSVRQLWQSSKDAGKTWTVAFDGLYRHPPG
jgi:hypothetical protein